jgi:hypothetical protein
MDRTTAQEALTEMFAAATADIQARLAQLYDEVLARFADDDYDDYDEEDDDDYEENWSLDLDLDTDDDQDYTDYGDEPDPDDFQ